MFLPWPGFEELPIRLQVEWQGRKRPVLMRIEQLPTTPAVAVPVCEFLDDPQHGEWLIGVGRGEIYTLGNPNNLLKLQPLFRVSTRTLETQPTLSTQRIQHLSGLIEQAFKKENNRLRVLRVVQIDDMPSLVHIALLSPYSGAWTKQWNSKDTVFFDIPGFDFYAPQKNAHEWLEREWNDTESDVRFAWNWSNWNDDERVIRSLGIAPDDISQLEQLLRWIFISSTDFWREHSYCYWRLDWDGEKNAVTWDLQANDLTSWEQWLSGHRFTQRRIDWMEGHLCVRDFWRYRPIVQIDIHQPPTMHERLEARLSLREWLQHNAPERMDLLEM